MPEPDWLDPTFNAQLYNIAQSVIWVSCGAAIVDGIRFAPFDWQILSGKRDFKWMMVFYFGTKLAWWSFMLINIIELNTLHRINCQAGMDAIEFMMGLLAVCSSALMACRTVCLYDGLASRRTSLVVKGTVILSGLGMLGTWLAGVDDVEMAFIPGSGGPWREGACQFVAVPSRYSAKYVVTVAFDLYVLILTFCMVRRLQHSGRLSVILRNQGLGYFLLTASANLTVCILCLLQRSPLLSLIGALPSGCICFLASTRLFVTLSESARPDSGVVESRNTDSTQSGRPPSEKLQSFLHMRQSMWKSRRKERTSGTEFDMNRALDKSQSLRSCDSATTLSPWRANIPLLPFHNGHVASTQSGLSDSSKDATERQQQVAPQSAEVDITSLATPSSMPRPTSSPIGATNGSLPASSPLRRSASGFNLGVVKYERSWEHRHGRSVSYSHLPRNLPSIDSFDSDSSSDQPSSGVTIRRSTEVRSERMLPPFTELLQSLSGSEHVIPSDVLIRTPITTSASRRPSLADCTPGSRPAIPEASFVPLQIRSRDQQELHRYRSVQQRVDEAIEQKAEERERRRKREAEKARLTAVMDALRAHPRTSSVANKRPSTAP